LAVPVAETPPASQPWVVPSSNANRGSGVVTLTAVEGAEDPAELNARTRYQYVAPPATVMSAYVVVSDPTLAI
jgi:hypothetical protein